MSINIYPPGTAVSNYEALSRLSKSFPKSVRVAKKMLTLSSKVDKNSLFKSRERKIQEIQSLVYSISRELAVEGYVSKSDSDADIVKDFFSDFSFCAPNWQGEYEFLDQFIDLCMADF
jgi:hypothetical protein